VAGVVAAAWAVAAAGAADVVKGNDMNSNKLTRLLAAFLCAGALILPAHAVGTFPTPEAAMEAFGAAVIDNDEAAKQAIVGKNYRDVIPPVDSANRYLFLEYWARSHKIEMIGDTKARIAVGDSGWTLPLPLVKTKAGWQFDMKAGKEEIIIRQIGRNELAAIKVARAFVEAQQEYAAQDRNGDGVPEYARKIVSSPGRTDGLYWPKTAGKEDSPLGRLIADAAAERGTNIKGSYHGYRYRILTAQGPDAPGGALDYVVNGHMTGGFGLLLWPAEYGKSGVMTFMINHQGLLLEKDLGPGTADKVTRLRTFNPDTSWRKVDNP